MMLPSFDMRALLGVAAALVVLYVLSRKKSHSTVFFSNVLQLQEVGAFTRSWLKLPSLSRYAALFFFALALIDPHYTIEKTGAEPRAGVAIYLVLDKSGSMSEETILRNEGARKKITKLELMKQVSSDFIQKRSRDLLGVVTFARSADVVSPLTLDQEAVLNQVAGIENVSAKERDGTSIGYAIYKTANLIAATRQFAKDTGNLASYDIKEGVIVLVTDGFQDPNPLDYGDLRKTMGVEEAAAFAKEQGVVLYIINVDPKMAEGRWAPQKRVMERAATATGGKFFQVDDGQSLSQVYEEIDDLEKSEIGQIVRVQRVSFYPYFIALGLMALFLSVISKTLLARKVA